MKRETVLALLRSAGYHEDHKLFIRTYTENRISLRSANLEYEIGRKMKKSGLPCDCFKCKSISPQPTLPQPETNCPRIDGSKLSGHDQVTRDEFDQEAM